MGKIFISAGHSSGDPGAATILGGTEAKEMMLTRDRIVEELEERHLYFLSVPDDLSLPQTIHWINNRAATGDVALEIHGNSADNESACGAEAYYVKGNDRRSEDAVKLLQALIKKVPELKNRGARPDNTSQHPRLAFCRDVSVPSVLLELCFMSSRSDMNLLTTRRQKFAEGIVDWLQVWSGQDRGSGPRVVDLPPTPIPTIDIKINDKVEKDKGILVNHNSFIPIDMLAELNISQFDERLKDCRQVTVGMFTYIKAIDLESCGVIVGFDNASKTVLIRSEAA